MTKKELVNALANFEDDDCVIVGDKETGWSNLGEIKQEGSCICLMEDRTRPFSSDN
jgi:hypothetical protein